MINFAPFFCADLLIIRFSKFFDIGLGLYIDGLRGMFEALCGVRLFDNWFMLFSEPIPRLCMLLADFTWSFSCYTSFYFSFSSRLTVYKVLLRFFSFSDDALPPLEFPSSKPFSLFLSSLFSLIRIEFLSWRLLILC